MDEPTPKDSGDHKNALDVLSVLRQAGELLGWVDFTSELKQSTGSVLRCVVSLTERDHSQSRYWLEVKPERKQGFKPSLRVKEIPEHRRLPAACPVRHINGDGTFCLGWGPSAPEFPRTVEEADYWWRRLAGYLDMQNQASYLRRWPKGMEWAHGDTAARYQYAFEALSEQLPPGIVSAVENCEVGIDPSGKLLNRRRPCPCGSGRKVKKCHEEDIQLLLLAKTFQHQEENMFWEMWRGHRCCGTMDNCPLDAVVP